MFAGKTIWQIFNMGGFTMYILLFCSILSVAVIIERIINFSKKSRIKRTEFMTEIKKELKNNNIEKAMEICKSTYSPFSNVIYAGLKLYNHNEKEISNSMEREIIIETSKLEQYIGIVGTIGNIAVYIGLFGTVLGIIRAFHDISVVGTGGMNVVIGGVAESLICTATGLSVAVPSVVVYNYFVRRIDTFVKEMELCASELLDLIIS